MPISNMRTIEVVAAIILRQAQHGVEDGERIFATQRGLTPRR